MFSITIEAQTGPELRTKILDLAATLRGSTSAPFESVFGPSVLTSTGQAFANYPIGCPAERADASQEDSQPAADDLPVDIAYALSPEHSAALRREEAEQAATLRREEAEQAAAAAVEEQAKAERAAALKPAEARAKVRTIFGPLMKDETKAKAVRDLIAKHSKDGTVSGVPDDAVAQLLADAEAL